MGFLENRSFNRILLLLFGAAFLFFTYQTFADGAFNLLFAAAALWGFIKTWNDLKKIEAGK